MTDYTKYKEVITYAPNRHAVIPELLDILPEYLDYDPDGNPVAYAADHIITRRNGVESVAIMLLSREERPLLDTLTSLQVLAEVERGGDIEAALDAVPANAANYDRVAPQMEVDGEMSARIPIRF